MKIRVTKKQAFVLDEILRRIKYLDKKEDDNLLVPLYPSEAKPVVELGLITVGGGNRELRGCINWYKLTDKGVRSLSKHLSSSISISNEDLFNGNRSFFRGKEIEVL